MLKQESGNRQFDRSGRTITSPAGALGISQVMPSTGPEAARLAGMPWDLNRLRTDPEYNHALGRAYYDAQLARFGDPVLAAAAYNGGPGRVMRATRAAGTTDFWTLARGRWLPSETDNYVPKIIAAAIIGKHPERYGFVGLKYLEPFDFDSVVVPAVASQCVYPQVAMSCV
jgi:soluble lytic murein transglycosylase-like protein